MPRIVQVSGELVDGGQAQIVNAGGHLAGAMVGEILGCILGGHRGQQERLPLLPDALMVVGPIGRGCLHSHVNNQSVTRISQLVSTQPNLTPQQPCSGPSRSPDVLHQTTTVKSLCSNLDDLAYMAQRSILCRDRAAKT